jgi:Tfp pilus assembly protein PilN
VRMLDDLNIDLPEKAWITEIKETAGLMRISGIALDETTIANFMRGLEGSEYFVKVDLGESRAEPKGGVPVKRFTLNVVVNYAGKKIPKIPGVTAGSDHGGGGTALLLGKWEAIG